MGRGEGKRCFRHLESSIFLFLPNSVGAEFADGWGKEGERQEGLRRGGGGRDEREFGEPSSVAAACRLQTQTRAPSASCPPSPPPASSSLLSTQLLILSAPSPGPGVNWLRLH